MKRKTSIVILGMVLTILLGLSLGGPQRGQAYFDCEMDRFNDFMNANDTYTTTFRSWYFGDPISCMTECSNQCNQLPAGPQRDQCMASISTCLSNCDSSRYDSFTSAQDALIMAANQPCTYEPDFCAEARYLRDLCVLTYNSQMENPVLDENQQIDGTWWGVVSTEYWSCRTASGIDQCE